MTGGRFVISLNMREHVERDGNPDDPWDIGEKHGVLEGFTARHLREWEKGLKHLPYEKFGPSYSPGFSANIGDTFAVAYALYTDGCTFGRYGLFGYILGVYSDTPEGTIEAIEKTREAKKPYNERHEERREGDPWPEFYPWNAHFAELEDVNVQSVTLLPERYAATLQATDGAHA